ncbi:hypothetical protein J6590_071398 [Homalodisca vitripennis]|nr:hypothetical protein J6590_071398 [Homalodisca vitripennis]
MDHPLRGSRGAPPEIGSVAACRTSPGVARRGRHWSASYPPSSTSKRFSPEKQLGVAAWGESTERNYIIKRLAGSKGMCSQKRTYWSRINIGRSSFIDGERRKGRIPSL